MKNRQQFVKFDSGLVENLETLSFKSDSREIDTSLNGVIIPHWCNMSRIGKTIEQNTYHKVAIETVSVDVSSNGYYIDDKNNEENNEIQENIRKFLDNLNILEISYIATFEYRLYGQTWLEVIREKHNAKGKILKLNILQSKYMYKDYKDDRIFRQMYNGKTVFFKNADYPGSENFDVNYINGKVEKLGIIPEDEKANEVYFLKNYNPDSKDYGFPIAINIMSVIIGDLKRGENNLNFFLRGGVPKYLITISGDFENVINKEEFENDPENVRPIYIEEWLESEMRVLESQNNPNGALVLTLQNNGQSHPIEVQFQEISSNTGEASHREYRKDNRDEILSAHQVPPYRLGIAETGSLGQTNIIEQNKIYNRKVIRPIQTSLEIIINKILTSQYGSVIMNRYRFEYDEIDLEDEILKLENDLKLHEFYLKELAAGVIDVEYYYELTGKCFSKFERDIEERMLEDEVIEEIAAKARGIN
jgi:capsid portal protein